MQQAVPCVLGLCVRTVALPLETTTLTGLSLHQLPQPRTTAMRLRHLQAAAAAVQMCVMRVGIEVAVC